MLKDCLPGLSDEVVIKKLACALIELNLPDTKELQELVAESLAKLEVTDPNNNKFLALYISLKSYHDFSNSPSLSHRHT
jgi:hypothetical protein